MTVYHVDRVARDLYVLRVDDRSTKYFEGLWEIPEGITYNSYVLTLPDKVVLFDGWKRDYAEEFLEALKEIVDINDIDIIVVHHMEPDHTGSLTVLLSKMNKQPMIYGHPMARSMLSSFYGLNNIKFVPTRDKMRIDLGDERILFIHTPWLHWPETIVTFLEERGVLLTCDVFGGYSIPRKLFDTELSEDEIRKYLIYARKYMVTVIGSYRSHVIPAIKKLNELGIKPSIIAPAHGLVWKQNLNAIINAYKDFAQNKYDEHKITIIYTSMYGFVEEIIDTIKDSLEKHGYTIKTYRFTDKERPMISEILTDVDTSKAVIIGISNYEASIHPHIENTLSILIKKIKARKPTLIITVYGWGDAAKALVKKKLENTPLSPINTISVKAGSKPQQNIIEGFLGRIISA